MAVKITQNGQTTTYDMRYIISGAYSGGARETVYGGYTTSNPISIVDVPLSMNSGQLFTGDPINVANGDVTHDETDISIPNLGAPLAVSRHYDSYNVVSGLAGAHSPWSDRGMGEGWSFMYSDRLEVNSDGSSVTWFNDKGVKLTFTGTGGVYTNPDGLFGTLTGSNATGYTWTDKNGSTVVFNAADANLHCSLARVLDRYGSGIDVTYLAGTSKIDRVEDYRLPATRSLQFTYTGDSITSISDFTGRTWTYGYTNGRLTSVTAPTDAQTPQSIVHYAYYTDNARLGLLYTVTDPVGGVTEYDYYANRRGFQVWSGFASTKTEVKPQSLSYNVFRDRTTFTDERGAVTSYDYDKANQGNLLQVIHPDRATEAYTWSTTNSSLKTSATDAYGQTESYVYDAGNMGDLIQVTDRSYPIGHVTTYTYTPDFHNVDTITRQNDPSDPSDDQVTKFLYNAQGSLTDKIDSYGVLNDHTTYVPLDNGLAASMTTPEGYLTPSDPNDYKTSYTYNEAGQLLRRDTRVSPTVTIPESFAYDSLGNMLTSTDGNGNTTAYTYDLLNRRKTQTLPDPDGVGTGLPAPHTTYAYDAAGNRIDTVADTPTTAPRSVIAVYDKKQQVTKTANPDGTYTTTVYDPAGNVAARTDAMGRVTRYVYDARNRLIATIQPDGSVVRTQCDGGSRVVGATDARGNTTAYQYDTLGRKIEEIQPHPNLAAATTVDDGDATGFATSGTWSVDSSHGGVGGDCRAASGTSNYATWTFSNLSADTEYEIFVTWVAFSNAATSAPYAVYDGAIGGTLLTTVNVNQQHDPGLDPDMGAGWLSLGTFLVTSGTLTVKLTGVAGGYVIADAARLAVGRSSTSYGYDARGNLQYVTNTSLGAALGDANYTTEYEYDALGRKTKEIQPDPDGAGFLARPTTYYHYDANGNLDGVTDARGAAPGDPNGLATYDPYHTTMYAYDEAGRKIREILPDPDGSGGPLGPLTTRYFYDADGNLTDVVAPGGSDAKEDIYTTAYQYDHLNRKILVRSPDPDGAGGQSAPETTYAYEANGNLGTVTDPLGLVTRYVYDVQGRQIMVTDALGAYPGDLAHSTTTFYDGVGNVLKVTDALGDSTSYEYDAANRKVLQTRDAPDKDHPGPQTSYAYDANGNLTSLADPRGYTTWRQYDALNRQIGVTDALGFKSGDPQHTATTVYDALGRVSLAIDPLGRATKYLYDNLGRKTETIAPDPATGQASETDPNCPKTYFGYDANGNLKYVTDPRGQVARDSDYTTWYFYDNLNRSTVVLDAAGNDPSPGEMVGHWTLDEQSGSTAADSSGFGNTGTVLGTGQQWVGGHIDGALEFNATSQVKVENIAADTAAGAQNTVSFWMKWDGTDDTMPFGWDGSYDLWLKEGNFGFNTGNGDVLGIPFPAATWANQWVYVTAVFYNGVPSANTVELYINGQPQQLAQLRNWPVGAMATSTAFISGWGHAGYYFHGAIDDVRIYNRALSDDEVARLSGIDPSSGNIVGHWTLDEQSGDTAADSSGYGNTGAMVGTGQQWVSGHIDGGLEFNGGSQVKVQNVPVDTAAGAKNTVSFWMKWDGTNGVMPFGWNGAYDLYVVNGTFGFNTGHGDVLGIPFSAATWANQWVHVTAVFYNGVPSADTVALSINGQRQELTQLLSTPLSQGVTSTAFISGWGATNDLRFHGTLDDVRIYNRALSDDEVARLSGIAPSFGPWDTLPEGWANFSTQTAYDELGNVESVTDQLVPQLTVVRPPKPSSSQLVGGLPIFPSRLLGVLRWQPPRDGQYKSSGMVWRTCG